MSSRTWVTVGYLQLGDRQLSLYRKPSGVYAVRAERGTLVVGEIENGYFRPRGKRAELVNGGQPIRVGGWLQPPQNQK